MATPGFPPPISNNGSMRGIVGTVEYAEFPRSVRFSQSQQEPWRSVVG